MKPKIVIDNTIEMTKEKVIIMLETFARSPEPIAGIKFPAK